MPMKSAGGWPRTNYTGSEGRLLFCSRRYILEIRLDPPDFSSRRSLPPESGNAGVPGYQSKGSSWSPDREDIERILAQSRHVEMRSIYYGSNACYLVVLEHPEAGRSLAVYKPARGEYPLWD